MLAASMHRTVVNAFKITVNLNPSIAEGLTEPKLYE
jgi:hypothetical protein